MSNQIKIDRLVSLLKGRREEYKIFGQTGDDMDRDAEIVAEIETLQESGA